MMGDNWYLYVVRMQRDYFPSWYAVEMLRATTA